MATMYSYLEEVVESFGWHGLKVILLEDGKPVGEPATQQLMEGSKHQGARMATELKRKWLLRLSQEATWTTTDYSFLEEAGTKDEDVEII